MTRDLSSGPKPGSRLPLLARAEPSLDRHPNDDWSLAEPYPMGPHARRALRSVIAALCPPAPAPRPSDIIDRIEQSARRLMRYMHPAASRGLWLALILMDIAPLFFRFAGRRLHDLDTAHARAVVRSLAASRCAPLRTVILGLRGLVLSIYFDQREIHDAIGYHPVSFIRERLKLRAQMLEPAPIAAE